MIALKILVLEDNVIVANDIKNIIQKAGHKDPEICHTYIDALRIMMEEPIDLALVDIELHEEKSGIDFAKQVNKSMPIPIVFLTSHSDDEKFKEASQTNPANYILKPFHAKGLMFQIELAYNQFHAKVKRDNEYMFFPIAQGLKKIKRKNVILIEAKGYTSYIYIKDQKLPEQFSINIGELSKTFTEPLFYKISRSCIINLEYVAEINNNIMRIESLQKTVVIPTNQKSKFLKRINIIRREK
ncbi:response regulator transcription factor [uncultured Arcticibacterium sp.]|uniref:response regulator transcription factor n=1 Tax=uncultured Arcticibacterium sp. TaxID=2173042 RepID=UPI0030FA34D8